MTIVSFVFIINAIYSSRESIANIENLQNILIVCIIFSFIYTLAIYAFGFVYKFSLELISNKKLSNLEILAVYTKANICKYLPGNVMQFVVRNLYAERIGLSQGKVALGSFIEVFVIATISVLICVFFIREQFFSIIYDMVPFVFYIISFIIFAIILCAICFLAKKYQFFHKVKYDLIEQLRKTNPTVFVGFVLKSATLVIFAQILAGTMFYYLIAEISSVSDVSIIIVVSAYTTAWLLGFITPGSPGGIGVKESVLLLTLTDIYGSGYILVSVLMFRIVTIFTDVLAFSFIYLITRKNHSIKNKQ